MKKQELIDAVRDETASIENMTQYLRWIDMRQTLDTCDRGHNRCSIEPDGPCSARVRERVESMQAVAGGVDTAALRQLIRGEADTAVKRYVNRPKVTKVYVGTADPIVIDGISHPALQECLRLIAAGHKNIMLIGPAGSGKSTLAKQIAQTLNRPFGTINCTAGMSEAHLLGRLNPFTGEYMPSAFVVHYEGGGVFLVDEADAADPNVMLSLNTATANGHCPIPNRIDNPIAERHEDNIIILAANTFGTGADAQYVGRDALDAATLDRYALARVWVDYSEELEGQLMADASRDLYQRLLGIRNQIAEHRLRRVLSTRSMVAARNMEQAGYSINEIVDRFLMGWSETEKAKVA